MLLKISQDDEDKFLPGNEKAQHFFRFLGKEQLSLKDLQQLLQERIEILFEIQDAEPATSALQTADYETKYLMWYNSHQKIWQGAKENGTMLKLFSHPVFRAKSKANLIDKMFYRPFARDAHKD